MRLRWESESGMSTFTEELDIPISETEGVRPGDFSSSGAPLRFRWSLPAGAVEFEGEGAWFFRPGGPFRFIPSHGFADGLARIGSNELDARILFWMALREVDLPLVAGLAELGYQELDFDDVVRLSRHDIDIEFLRAAHEVCDHPSIGDLVTLRSRGIDTGVLRGYEEAGIVGLPVDEIVQLHARGVAPAYLQAILSSEIAPAGVESEIQLRQRGVDSALAAAIAGLGFVDVGEILQLHARGVPIETVRALRELGFEGVEEIIQLHARGVPVEMIRGLHELGYGQLDVDDLLRLRSSGVDPDFVRRLAGLGFSGLSVEDLVRARLRGDDALEEIRRAR
jgi:hypothetical protein